MDIDDPAFAAAMHHRTGSEPSRAGIGTPGDDARARDRATVKGATGAGACLSARVDADNARYWHDRAGTKMPEISLEKEWHALVDELLRDESK